MNEGAVLLRNAAAAAAAFVALGANLCLPSACHQRLMCGGGSDRTSRYGPELNSSGVKNGLHYACVCVVIDALLCNIY